MKCRVSVACALGLWVLAGLVFLPSVALAQGKKAAFQRPYEAPSFGASSPQGLSRVLPALPPEYLRHQQPGAHFAYHPSAREQVRLLIAHVASLRRKLTMRLGRDYLPKVVRVRLAVSEADMLRVVPLNSPPSELLVLANANLLVLRSMRGSNAEVSSTETMFRRGLALMALDKVVPADSLPLWFRVGFASRFAAGLTLAQSRSIWWASMRGDLLPLESLGKRLTGPSGRNGLAEVQAHALVSHLERNTQTGSFHRLIRSLSKKSSFDASLTRAYRMDMSELDASWRRSFARHRSFVPVLLASLGLWFAVMFVGAWRQRKARDAESDDPSEGSHTLAAAVGPAAQEVDGELQEMIRLGGYASYDAGVPKVVHGGDWHTLH